MVSSSRGNTDTAAAIGTAAAEVIVLVLIQVVFVLYCDGVGVIRQRLDHGVENVIEIELVLEDAVGTLPEADTGTVVTESQPDVFDATTGGFLIPYHPAVRPHGFLHLQTVVEGGEILADIVGFRGRRFGLANALAFLAGRRSVQRDGSGQILHPRDLIGDYRRLGNIEGSPPLCYLVPCRLVDIGTQTLRWPRWIQRQVVVRQDQRGGEGERGACRGCSLRDT